MSPDLKPLTVEERVALLERISDNSPSGSSASTSASTTPRTPRGESVLEVHLRDAEKKLEDALVR